ncbi:MAG: SEL1-like repeat protein [Deltaproteobacteria bacterium]|jgi:TPR repeat protein|nr:SEL1-like repeat protein [Deltaproteobacteria bacterium]
MKTEKELPWIRQKPYRYIARQLKRETQWMSTLGARYEGGDGVPQNKDEALKWFI